MKKIILIALLLGACADKSTGLATQVQIPPLPENLARKFSPLSPSDDLTMGGQVRDNTHNIRQYNDAYSQSNKLVDLYNCVREAVNNKKEPKCL